VAEENAAAKESSAKADAAAPSKPLMLYVLVIINMIVVGGVGFMVYKGNIAKSHQTTIEEVTEGAKKDNEEDKIKEEKEFVGKTIPLETFLINLSGSQGRKLLKVNMELEVEGDKTPEEVEKRKAAVRDMILLILSSKRYEDVSTIEGKDRLRDEIKEQLNRVLKKGLVKQVLFTEFIYN
jgi:flagellar FliL protein